MSMKKIFTLRNAALVASAFAAGVINALLGTGAGLVFVILLGVFMKNTDKRNVYASVSFIIFFLCIVSAAVYAVRGDFSIRESGYFALAGIIGGSLGALLLDVIKPKYLKYLLSGLLVYSGIRLIMR